MDLEAPMDAWYVWLGVSLVSIGLASFAISIPSTPPPDAEGAASVIDRVAASDAEASATHEHDATAVRLGPERLEMRNDGGIARSRISFGTVFTLESVANSTAERRAFEGFLAGTQPLNDTMADALITALAAVPNERTTGHSTPDAWRPADGTLRARAVTVADSRVVLVDA